MTTQTAIRTISGPRILRPREIRALLQAPDKRRRLGKRDAALLGILATGGLRIGEAVRLVVDSVETDKGRMRLTIRTSKSGGRYRVVTLPRQSARLLAAWLVEASPRLFVFEGHHHEALSVRQGERIATRWLRHIGRGDLTTHGLRHTVGATITRGSGLWVAQNVLGHADPRTTSKYYSAYSTEDADKAANALEEIL